MRSHGDLGGRHEKDDRRIGVAVLDCRRIGRYTSDGKDKLSDAEINQLMVAKK
jgi:hypothetical protein